MIVHDPNVFPDVRGFVVRADKEKLLKQHSIVIWMTGLSGAGKSTLAKHLESELYQRGFLSQILDGDNIRSGINNKLSFTEEDRFENLRRIAEISKLFVGCGIICINSFISPTHNVRAMARQIIGAGNFVEVFVNAPLSVCEKRDVKGLYSKARKGEIKNFTGIDAPYELPGNAEIVVKTDLQTVEESVDQIVQFILPLIEFKKV